MGLTKKQVENRVKWVRALLSGDYEQGSGTLKRKLSFGRASYCCLGVACEVVSSHARELRYKSYSDNSSGYMTDRRAIRKFGMSSIDQPRASRWNDADRYSFGRIADFVAYATEHGMSFTEVGYVDVPEGYATEWLENQ